MSDCCLSSKIPTAESQTGYLGLMYNRLSAGFMVYTWREAGDTFAEEFTIYEIGMSMINSKYLLWLYILFIKKENAIKYN